MLQTQFWRKVEIRISVMALMKEMKKQSILEMAEDVDLATFGCVDQFVGDGTLHHSRKESTVG